MKIRAAIKLLLSASLLHPGSDSQPSFGLAPWGLSLRRLPHRCSVWPGITCQTGNGLMDLTYCNTCNTYSECDNTGNELCGIQRCGQYDLSIRMNCVITSPVATTKSYEYTQGNPWDPSVVMNYRDIFYPIVWPMCPPGTFYNTCTLTHTAGVNQLSQITTSGSTTTIKVPKVPEGIGVYKLNCPMDTMYCNVYANNKAGMPLSLDTPTNAITIKINPTKCAPTTITPITDQQFILEVHQSSGFPDEWVETRWTTDFFSLSTDNAPPNHCTFTNCRVDYGCGTDYPQISETFSFPQIDLHFKTDQLADLTVCVRCTTDAPSSYTVDSSLYFKVVNNCAQRISMPTVSDFKTYITDASSIANKKIQDETTTNEPVLCPRDNNLKIINQDGSDYTGGLIGITSNGEVRLIGVHGVLPQKVKIRITTTLGLQLETGLFMVSVIDCCTLLTEQAHSSSYLQSVPNPSTLNGVQLFLGWATSDATNCPMSSASLVQGGSYAAYTGGCITVSGTTSVKWAGIKCTPAHTDIRVKVTSAGGAIVYSTPFSVEVRIDCLPHLQQPSLNALYQQVVPVASSVNNQVLIANSVFTTTDATNCPITSIQILQSGSVYSTIPSCLSVDGSKNVVYNGIFCKEQNLQIRISTTGGNGGATIVSTTTFTAEVKVDCMPHFQFPTLSSLYQVVVPVASSVTNQVFQAGTTFGTSDPTNCPITGYDLDLGGSPYNQACAKVDASGNLKYAGIFCLVNGLKMKLITTGGGGYSKLSSPFNVEVKVQCLPHLGVPTPSSPYFRKVPDANSVLNEVIIAGSGFTTADAVNCPLTTSSYRLMKGVAPYSTSCVQIDTSGNVKLGGVFCVETGLYVELSTVGGDGAVKNTATFDVTVEVDCLPHLQQPTFSSPYLRVEPFASTALNQVFIANTVWPTTNPSLCPVTSVQLIKGGSPYSGPCVQVDASRNIVWRGVFCTETDLKVKISTTGGNGALITSTASFNAELRVDCMPHFQFPTMNNLYQVVVPVSSTVTDQVFLAASSFGTADATNCPITAIGLDLGGSPYSPQSCGKVDGSGNMKYVGVFCLKSGLKVKLSTTGGGGYSKLSSAFTVEVKVDCFPNLGVPSLASPYFRKVVYSSSVLNELIIAGSGFTTVDPVNCPLTSTSYKLMKGGAPYSTSCVSVDTSGNVKLGGVFCVETNLYVDLYSAGGDGATKPTSLFNIEVQVDCNPLMIPQPLNNAKYFEEPLPLSTILNKILFLSFVSNDLVNCPLQTFNIIRNGAVFASNCISVDSLGYVKYLAQYCQETGLKMRVQSVHGSQVETNTFDVTVQPKCSKFLSVHNIKQFYFMKIPVAADSVVTPIFNGSSHFSTNDTVLCPITSYDLFESNNAYTKNCVSLRPHSGNLHYRGRFCEEIGLRIRVNSMNGHYIFSNAFTVSLSIDCVPHLQHQGFESYYWAIVPSRRNLFNRRIFRSKEMIFTTDPQDCPIDIIRLMQNGTEYNDTYGCIQMNSIGNVMFNGIFCNATNFTIQFGTKGQAIVDSPVFNVSAMELFVEPVNHPPIFYGPIPNLGIIIDENQDQPKSFFYQIELPEWVDDHGQLMSLSIDSHKFGNILFVNSSSSSSSGKLVLQDSKTSMLAFTVSNRTLSIFFKDLITLKNFEGPNGIGFTLKDWKFKQGVYFTNVHVKIIPKVKRAVEVKPKEERERGKNPVILKIKEITRDGMMYIKFNQELQVPGWIDQTGNATKNSSLNESEPHRARELMKLWEINVKEDVMDLSLIFNSHIDPESVTYNLTIMEWRTDGMKVHVNFSDPLLISRGRILDEVIVKVMNKELFTSKDMINVLEEERIYIQKPIERQLPWGFSEEELREQAKTAAYGLGAMFFVQLCLQICLKGLLTDLWVLYFTLQIICYLQVYQVSIPANAEIYQKELTNLVEFEILNPDTIGEVITGNSNFKTSDFLLQLASQKDFDDEQIPGLMDNLSTFIMIGCIIVAALLLVWIIACCSKKGREMITKLKEKVFFNLIIRSFTIVFIKICVECGRSITKYIQSENDDQSYSDYVIGSLLFTGLFLYILVSWCLIQNYKPFLHEDRIQKRIGNFYEGVKLTRRMDIHLIYYPMFLIRRIIFVAIPTFLFAFPFYQVQILIFLTSLYIIYYADSQPHVIKERVLIEIFNEWWIMIMVYHMIAFSEFVMDPWTQFVMGYSFVINIAFVIFVNLAIIALKQIKKYQERRKVRRQLNFLRELTLKQIQMKAELRKIAETNRAQKKLQAFLLEKMKKKEEERQEEENAETIQAAGHIKSVKFDETVDTGKKAKQMIRGMFKRAKKGMVSKTSLQIKLETIIEEDDERINEVNNEVANTQSTRKKGEAMALKAKSKKAKAPINLMERIMTDHLKDKGLKIEEILEHSDDDNNANFNEKGRNNNFLQVPQVFLKGNKPNTVLITDNSSSRYSAKSVRPLIVKENPYQDHRPEEINNKRVKKKTKLSLLQNSQKLVSDASQVTLDLSSDRLKFESKEAVPTLSTQISSFPIKKPKRSKRPKKQSEDNELYDW